MSDKLTKKSNFIISATSTPSSSEIANQQFCPQSLKIGSESLASSDSGRDDAGNMHVFWVRSKIVKLEITMKPLTAAEQSTILNLVQGKTFYITYFDTVSGAERTCQAYCSSSSSDCYSGILYNGLWTGVAFNIIEL